MSTAAQNQSSETRDESEYSINISSNSKIIDNFLNPTCKTDPFKGVFYNHGLKDDGDSLTK